MTTTAPARPRPGRRLRRGLKLAAAATLTFLAATPLATTAAQPTTETIRASETVTLEVRRGSVLRLTAPAATVFVADPEIADVQAQSPTLVYLFGRRAGTTSLYAVDDGDRVLLRADVVVEHNLSGLRQAIGRLVPDGAVEVGSVDGSIVLSGSVENSVQVEELRALGERFLGEDEELLNRVRVASPTQVHIKVQVAEVSREVIKEFGINWEAFLQAGNFAFAFATGRDLNNGGGFLRAPPNAGTAEPSNVFADYTGRNGSARAAIDALAEEGLINLLAEPNLTALSGETASFLAGGEFPIPVATTDDTVKIEFKQFGISLAFTPTVLSGDRISLRVRPEVSELSNNGAITLEGLTIPALATRRAETTVELGSGQSFMIGGLLASDVQSAVSKFPGLGDLPVLGTLFRSNRFQRKESELVILVTPYLVRPVAAQRLARPTDGFAAPTDLERILEGRLHRARLRPGQPGPVAPEAPRLRGPIGFVLE